MKKYCSTLQRTMQDKLLDSLLSLEEYCSMSINI